MEISLYAEEKIKEFEGLRLTAYKCAAGKWTIGWGHTGKVDGLFIRKGLCISMPKAQELFVADVERIERELALEPFWARLQEPQRDAIVSFVFNLGFGNFKNSTLRRKLVANVEDVTIPDEFRRWVYATVDGEKVILPGLVTRREWEAQMYEDL